MKKSLIFKILYLFLVLVVVAGASVFATNTYLASQVSYGNTNVEDALNGLFTLKGNDENYSTDEKVVGKWIDNKPIYRKVFDIGTVLVDSTPREYNVCTQSSLNMQNLINYGGTTNWDSNNTSSNPYSLPIHITLSNNFFINLDVYVNTNSDKIVLRTYRSSNSTTAYNTKVVLEYTKTTD